MTLVNKLTTIKNAMKSIKEALKAKGVTPSGDITTYPDAIQSIETSGGGVVAASDPLEYASLRFWLDGDYNTPRGKNHDTLYFYNIVGNTSTLAKTTNGSWTDNYFNFSSSGCTYLDYRTSTQLPITIEAVIKITEYQMQDIFNWQYGSGIILRILGGSNTSYPQGTIMGGVFDSDISDIQRCLSEPMELNKPYYIVYRIDSENKKSTLTVKSIDSTDITEAEFTTYKSISTSYYAGVGNLPSTSTSTATTRYNTGLQLGMLRVWSKILTDSDIDKYFEDVKQRFNF